MRLLTIALLLFTVLPVRAEEPMTLTRLIESGAHSAVSVTEPAKSPYWSYRVGDNGRLQTLLDDELAARRRQELPEAYVLNGAVYAAHIDWLLQHGGFVGEDTVAHVMPADRSLDVDTALDLQMVDLLLRQAS